MRLLFLLPFLLLSFALTGAESEEPRDWLETADRALDAYKKELKGWDLDPPSDARVGNLYREILEFKNSADACVDQAKLDQESAKGKAEALGPSTKGEDPELGKRRREITNEQKQQERRLAFCRLLSLSGIELQSHIQQFRQKTFSQELGTRETPLWKAVSDSFQALANGGENLPPAQRPLQFELGWNSTSLGISALIILFPLAFGLRGWLLARLKEKGDGPRGYSLGRMYAYRLPWVAGLLVPVLFLYGAGAKPLFAPLLAIAAALLLSPLMQLLICRSKEQCSEGLPVRTLFALILLTATLHLVRVHDYLPEPIYLSLRALVLLLLPILALWLFNRLSRREDMGLLDAFRKATILALLAGPAADWLGYRNLGNLLLLGVYGTATGAFLFWQIYRAASSALLRLEGGDGAAARFRQLLGYADNETIQGLVLIRQAIGALLLAAFGYWLLRVWQISPADTAVIYDVLFNGFQIGAVNIVPLRLLVAGLTFMVLWVFAKWLRRQMHDRWLMNSRLDAGARQSIVTLTGYTVIGAGLLVVLSIMGADFQNLAIIAGALSVGIGFGLQNIVNNFVSGLILLFERPVRPGDWVVIGGTEGYVKKISIRYTLIQTFDRADVMVPNSELISHQVTNWMLRDSIGRVIVPVGVAYGTDTERVKETLLRIANAHPMVIGKSHGVASPNVLFISFGDSCLNFELRCFIRDIDKRYSVRSDLLFAIEKTFREAGIEIPYPQRVYHIAPPLPAEKTPPEHPLPE